MLELRRISSVGLLVSALAGCAYRVPTAEAPESMPLVAREDIAVADIAVSDATGTLDAAALSEVRSDASQLLDQALDPGSSPGTSRLTIRVELVSHENHADRALSQDGFAIFGLWPALLGMVIDTDTVVADVTLEKNGLVYRGKARETRGGSLFAPSRKRALAAAIHGALAAAEPLAQ